MPLCHCGCRQPIGEPGFLPGHAPHGPKPFALTEAHRSYLEAFDRFLLSDDPFDRLVARLDMRTRFWDL